MEITYQKARELAAEPQSRFWFGSPCRFIARVDFTCHVLIPSLLRRGDTTQQGRWDRGRVTLGRRLLSTSPRWQHLVSAYNPKIGTT